MQYPYKKATATAGDGGDDEVTFDISAEYDAFPDCSSFYLGTKWNGVRCIRFFAANEIEISLTLCCEQINVIFYTYRDFTNHIYVTATTRGYPFLSDSIFGNVKTATLQVIANWQGKSAMVRISRPT